MRSFRTSPLQYARLREFQQELYLKKIALISSVITRWGTQCRQILSVLNNKDALRRYALKYTPADIGTDAHAAISSTIYWAKLEGLREVIAPIDKDLLMSESNNNHLGHVMKRWEVIGEHLTTMEREHPALMDFMKPNGKFPQRLSIHFYLMFRFFRQVLPIHYAAYFLDPEPVGLGSTPPIKDQVYVFFDQITASPEESRITQTEFLCFRNQMPPFEPTRRCWIHRKEPRMFWLMIMADTKFIGRIAHRIFSTPANSVPSERAFSTQNYIHTKVRNALKPATTNKLTYLYMNTRIFRAVDNEMMDMSYMITEDEEVALEDALLQTEEEENEDDVIRFEVEE